MPVAVAQITETLKDTLNISSAKSKNVVTVPGQPDIEYHPDEAKWKARTARRLAEDLSLPSTPLPAGFPQKLDSPLVWQGSDWKDEKEWVYELNADQLKEVDDALKHFRSTSYDPSSCIYRLIIVLRPALDKPLGYISPSTFPLPSAGPILSNLARDLHTGRGFFVLRGIPVDSYTREENVIIYAGVSSYVGGIRAGQDGTSVLAHIKDLTQIHPAKTIGAPAYTTDKQVYHTDAGDIIALFALETAAQGGVSRISSSWKVYNELAETRPDLIKTLSEPWAWDGFVSLLHYFRSS